jgi:hypothetical protein
VCCLPTCRCCRGLPPPATGCCSLRSRPRSPSFPPRTSRATCRIHESGPPPASRCRPSKSSIRGCATGRSALSTPSPIMARQPCSYWAQKWRWQLTSISSRAQRDSRKTASLSPLGGDRTVWAARSTHYSGWLALPRTTALRCAPATLCFPARWARRVSLMPSTRVGVGSVNSPLAWAMEARWACALRQPRDRHTGTDDPGATAQTFDIAVIGGGAAGLTDPTGLPSDRSTQRYCGTWQLAEMAPVAATKAMTRSRFRSHGLDRAVPVGPGAK